MTDHHKTPAEHGSALPAVIVSGPWELVAFGQPDGDVEDTRGTNITASFNVDGRVSGSGGCNRYSGSYTVGKGGALELQGFMTTRMACLEPIMGRELRYLKALGQVT